MTVSEADNITDGGGDGETFHKGEFNIRDSRRGVDRIIEDIILKGEFFVGDFTESDTIINEFDNSEIRINKNNIIKRHFREVINSIFRGLLF